MKKSKKGHRQSILAEVLTKVTPKIGAKVIFEPEYGIVGCIAYKGGQRRYFRYSTLDINRMGASEISRDKGYSKYFMELLEYPVVPGDVFYSKKWCQTIGSKKNIDQAYAYARRMGFPVIVKPNSKSQGKGVVKVFTRSEFYKAMRQAFKYENVVLVENAINGASDYRIVVLDNQVISAYQRLPLRVIGNGRSTIKGLLQKKQREFRISGRDSKLNLKDSRLLSKMTRLGLTYRSVLEKDRQVFLLDNANLSSGGESRDVTGSVHSDFKKLAIQLTKDMGLRLCGVDILVKGGTLAEPAKEFFVLEINSAPGLDHYAKIGKQQKKIVENLYLKVVKAMEH